MNVQVVFVKYLLYYVLQNVVVKDYAKIKKKIQIKRKFNLVQMKMTTKQKKSRFKVSIKYFN
jgi:hypothetical protein